MQPREERTARPRSAGACRAREGRAPCDSRDDDAAPDGRARGLDRNDGDAPPLAARQGRGVATGRRAVDRSDRREWLGVGHRPPRRCAADRSHRSAQTGGRPEKPGRQLRAARRLWLCGEPTGRHQAPVHAERRHHAVHRRSRIAALRDDRRQGRDRARLAHRGADAPQGCAVHLGDRRRAQPLAQARRWELYLSARLERCSDAHRRLHGDARGHARASARRARPGAAPGVRPASERGLRRAHRAVGPARAVGSAHALEDDPRAARFFVLGKSCGRRRTR